MVSRPDLAPLRSWERWGLLAFLALLTAFGVILEIRCAFLPNRQTDLGVYLRAAWAARVGENPYTIEDENGWHFCYPPVVALALTPLADAPPGVERPLMLPWTVLVIVWYVLSLACLFLAVHLIAGALESRSSDPAVRDMPAGCRRWWYNRLIPVWLGLVQIGSTLSRGQVNLMVILCVAGVFAALVHRQRLRGGLWLAAAICLKVIPAFLLLVPLWRRDSRMLAGSAFGLFVGILALPSLYWGPAEAWNLNMQMVGAVLHPGMGEGGDQTRAKELTDLTATDNQSFQATLHNYQHWDRLHERPGQPSAATRGAHWLLSGGLTLAILLAAGWRRQDAQRDDDPVRLLLFLGALFLLMTMVTPVSHLHYFSMALPLMMGLAAASPKALPHKILPRPAMLALLIAAGVGFALPSIPIWDVRREAGLSLLVSLVLMGVAMKRLAARPIVAAAPMPVPELPSVPLRRAA